MTTILLLLALGLGLVAIESSRIEGPRWAEIEARHLRDLARRGMTRDRQR